MCVILLFLFYSILCLFNLLLLFAFFRKNFIKVVYIRTYQLLTLFGGPSEGEAKITAILEYILYKLV